MKVLTSSGPRLVHLALGLLAGWLALPVWTAAQEPKPRVAFDGTHCFRNLLHTLHAKPLQQVWHLSADPKNTLLIVFGDTAVLDEVAQATGGLAAFQQAGGSILIASDRAESQRLRELGIQITGAAIAQPAALAYRGQPECPLVTSFKPAEGPQQKGVQNPLKRSWPGTIHPGENPDWDVRNLVGNFRGINLRVATQHPLFDGLKHGIATNRPSSLVRQPDSRLAKLASLARPDVVSDDNWYLHGVEVMAGSGEDAKLEGRVLILAGHGVFMNCMFAQSDNDNFAFAFNCVRWLTAADQGQPKRVLFVENGQVHNNFEVPLTELPHLPIPPARVLNDLLRGLEEENRFNRFLLDWLGRSRILQVVFLLLSGGMLFCGLRRLVVHRHRVELALPLVARSVARRLAAPPVLTQRRQELLRQGNLWEAARALARQGFEGHTVVVEERLVRPALVLKGGWWQNWKLRRQVVWLWDLAYGPEAVPVSRRRLARVQAAAKDVGAALKCGMLVLAPGADSDKASGRK